MKNNTKKIFAASALVPFLLSAGLAFAQPVKGGHENVPVNPQAQEQANKGPAPKKAPAPQAHNKKPGKRYVKVRGKHGKFITIDCWKKSNKRVPACNAR